MAYVKHEDLCGAFKGKYFMGFFKKMYFFLVFQSIDVFY